LQLMGMDQSTFEVLPESPPLQTELFALDSSATFT